MRRFLAGFGSLGIAALLTCGFLLWSSDVGAASVDELKEELDQKREQLREVEEKIAEFKQNIQIKKQEARTLANQLELIEDGLEELELGIRRTIAEIEKTNLEIQTVNQEIIEKEAEISHQKDLLGDFIRSMNKLEQQSVITVFLRYSTFSEAVNEASTITELNARTQQTLHAIQQLHAELSTKRQQLEIFSKNLDSLKQRQQDQQQTLTAQQASKENILTLTQAQEQKFKNLLQVTQQAHQAAEADIKRLDSVIREELKKEGVVKLTSVGRFSWPVGTPFGISCEFHCAGYPYEYLIGPHSGIDIPTYVGTPILAPADGYVARAHRAGGAGYSYIMVVHGDNLSTVFGHVSSIAVNEGQLVSRGAVIGYTGGAPGTNGAGLSSGPHLHFEVRHDNVPVNPRSFLE